MRTLRLFALGINQLRDIFGANDELAKQLREVAADVLPRSPKPRSLWHRIGPLLRDDPALRMDPSQPNPGDIDILTAGGYVPPERNNGCWLLLLHWLEHLSPHHATITIQAPEDVEFDLARLGLSSQYSLERLAEQRLSVPLWPLPQQMAGYAKHAHAVATCQALQQVLDHPMEGDPMRPSTREVASAFVEFLSYLEGKPELDVITISTTEITGA